METIYSFPLLFDPSEASDKEKLAALINEKNPKILDNLEALTQEYVQCEHFDDALEGEGGKELWKQWLAKKNISSEGTWIYYPWRNLLVHMLQEEPFIAVRTNRNQLKITKNEQKILGEKKILFVGLSVGQSALMVFAQQRIGSHFVLADFDTLSLSNINRLKASIADIGELKCDIAARNIAEMDPYIVVETIPLGITKENIDSVLNPENGNKPDLIIEECDNLEVKIHVRLAARKYGIPVLMETSDRGMMDIERFDLEPTRPIFHGLVKEEDLVQANKLPVGEKMAMLYKIVDYENLSARMLESAPLLGKSLHSWPQLSYEVNLGAATLAYCGMKILLGHSIKSGRYYVDLDSIFETNK